MAVYRETCVSPNNMRRCSQPVTVPLTNKSPVLSHTLTGTQRHRRTHGCDAAAAAALPPNTHKRPPATDDTSTPQNLSRSINFPSKKYYSSIQSHQPAAVLLWSE